MGEKRKRRPSGYWTRETVIREIRERVKKGESLQPSVVLKEDSSLITTGYKLFKGWKEAVEESGYSVNNYYGKKPNGYWTKEKVQRKLKNRLQDGKGIYQSELMKEDGPLYSAMITVYGDWITAVESIGENIEDHMMVKPKGYWTEETVMSGIQSLKREGKSIKRMDIRKEDSALYEAVLRTFGEFDKLYEAMGEDVLEYRVNRPFGYWNKETVRVELQERVNEGKPLTAREVSQDHSTLYKNGIKYYGKWKTAVKEVVG